MGTRLRPHTYHSSLRKRLFDIGISLFLLVTTFPLLITVALIIKAGSKGPVFFRQKRIGKNGKTFQLIKFRTMNIGAERQKWRYRHLNEVGGPVFKIKNDSRFVGIGKFLARTGLDEAPQLLNVVKGEMSLVGP